MLYQSDINTAITNCNSYIKEITTDLVNSLSYGTKRQLQLKRNLNVLKGCKRILSNYTPYKVEPKTLHKVTCSKSDIITVGSTNFYTDITSGSFNNTAGRNDIPGVPASNRYTFTIAEESSVSIFLDTSENVDAYLHLLNASNTEIDSSDDDGGDRDSLIETTLSAGTYTIVANTYSDNEYGNYTLKFYSSNPVTGDLEFTNEQRVYNLGLQIENSIVRGSNVYVYSNIVENITATNSTQNLNVLTSADTILTQLNYLTTVELQKVIDSIEEYKDKEYTSELSVSSPTDDVYNGGYPEVSCGTGTGSDHEQNTDIKLAQGTVNEVTAANLRAHLDNSDIHLTTSQITALIQSVLSSQNDATFNGPNQVKVADENGNVKILTIGEDEILTVKNGIIKNLKVNRIIGGGASTTF